MVTALAVLAWVSLVGFPVFVAIAVRGVRSAIDPTQPPDMSVDPAVERPAVSVLKPCAGVDDDLEACLGSFCVQRGVPVQVLFGVEREDDPAMAVIQRVRAQHPVADIDVVVTGPGELLNPKIARCAAMLPHAKHALLWLSDSNTHAHPDTLAGLLATLAVPGTGCAASNVAGSGERDTGAALHNLHLCSYAGMGTYVAHAIAGLVGTGKSVLLSRDTLERVGGFPRLGRHAGDDVVLFQAVQGLGLKVGLAPHVVLSITRTTRMRDVLTRALRWAQIRHRTVGWASVWEPLLSPVIPTLVLLAAAPSRWHLALAIAGALEQAAADRWFVRRLRGRTLRLRYGWLHVVRPWLMLGPWAWAWVRRTTQWRGVPLSIGARSEITSRAGR